MANILDELRKVANWATKPRGFDGAWLLADLSEEAAASLSSFIRHTHRGAKTPPWLAALLKGAAWHKKTEVR
jgi:hypothetical protein